MVIIPESSPNKPAQEPQDIGELLDHLSSERAKAIMVLNLSEKMKIPEKHVRRAIKHYKKDGDYFYAAEVADRNNLLMEALKLYMLSIGNKPVLEQGSIKTLLAKASKTPEILFEMRKYMGHNKKAVELALKLGLVNEVDSLYKKLLNENKKGKPAVAAKYAEILAKRRTPLVALMYEKKAMLLYEKAGDFTNAALMAGGMGMRDKQEAYKQLAKLTENPANSSSKAS